MAETIGFVGVGRMGANMARNLADKGFNISAVFDANADAAQALAEELSCAAPQTLAEVTAQSDVVITVVTDDAAMRAIFSTSGDSLLTDAEGTIFINCATISPAVHVEVEEQTSAVGASSLEGCMASSITQAREGTLYLMCGGKRNVFDQVHPILDALSVDLLYIGHGRSSGPSQGPRQHGHEHQHRRLSRGVGARASPRIGPRNADEGLFSDWRQLAGTGNRWRGHDHPRPRVLLLRGPRG